MNQGKKFKSMNFKQTKKILSQSYQRRNYALNKLKTSQPTFLVCVEKKKTDCK